MGKTPDAKYKSHSLLVLETLLALDLWLLVKSRRWLSWLFRLLAPTLRAFALMLLGAAVLLAWVLLARGRLDVERSEACVRPALAGYPEIVDDSKAFALRKELVRMKGEATSLEKTLYRMNVHLIDMYNRQRNMDANLADFASEAIGGLVIDTPNTQTYVKPASNQVTIFGIPVWKTNQHTPRKIIQPWTEPGECWAFRGSAGKIEIELAYPAFIERVTLEHISASASLTGRIDEAPKTFNVLGKLNDEYVMIDTFMYKSRGLPSQTFEVNKPELKMPFRRIILEILSNWGNPDYTCIYRFKVHGRMYVSSNEANMKVQ